MRQPFLRESCTRTGLEAVISGEFVRQEGQFGDRPIVPASVRSVPWHPARDRALSRCAAADVIHVLFSASLRPARSLLDRTLPQLERKGEIA